MIDDRKESMKMISLWDEQGAETDNLLKLKQIYDWGKFGPYNLFIGQDDVPPGLSSKYVWDAVYGQKRKRLKEKHLLYILKTFSKYIISPIRPRPPSPRRRAGVFMEYVTLLDDQGNETAQLKQLMELKKKTGIAQYKLLMLNAKIPLGLSAANLIYYMGGKCKRMPKPYFDFVVKRWMELSETSLVRIEITDEIINILKYHSERTKIKHPLLLRRSQPVPAGLTDIMIWGWLSGTAKTLRKSHLDFVIDKWSSWPTYE